MLKLETRELKAGEIGLSIILVLFSIFAIYQSYRINGADLTISSPGAFPTFISIMLLIFSIWILVENYRSNIQMKNTIKEKINDIGSLTLSKEILLIIIFIIIYALIIDKIGFVVSTIMFLWISISFLSKEKIFINLGLSILIVAGIVLIFNTIFNVVLP